MILKAISENENQTYSIEDFENTIGTDYFHSGLCIIEWGEIIKDILPTNTIYITIYFILPYLPHRKVPHHK